MGCRGAMALKSNVWEMLLEPPKWSHADDVMELEDVILDIVGKVYWESERETLAGFEGEVAAVCELVLDVVDGVVVEGEGSDCTVV